MTRRRWRGGRRRRDGRRRRRGARRRARRRAGEEFLEHGRELAEDLEVEGAVRGGGGPRRGPGRARRGMEIGTVMRSVTGCARWRRSERGVRAVLVRERARRAVDGEELVDESTPPEEETRALRTRSAQPGGAAPGASGGSRYAFASTRSFRSARKTSRRASASPGAGSSPDASVSARDSRQRPSASTSASDCSPGGWRSRRSSSPEFAMTTVDPRAIPDDDTRGRQCHEATLGARRRTLSYVR